MKEFKNTLEKCGYKVFFTKTKDEAFNMSKTYIKENMVIGLGGSTTVKEIGLLDYVTTKKNITLHNQYEKGISIVENTSRRRLGMLSDLYITSTNAITKDGTLVNADGSGNRVASMIFGPKNVLLIIGQNKICDTVENAQIRIMDVAASKNIDRMNGLALESGKEAKWNKDNIASKFTQIKNDVEGRIIIIFVEEDLGY